MSRTFKDRPDRDQDLHNGRTALCNAAWARVRTDKVFAASLGFYTGINESGQVVSEAQAVDHLADVLNRGQ